MRATASTRLRSLPFNAIDEAFADAGRTDDSLSIEFELRSSARIDEQRLRLAIREAIRSHPLAGAKQAPFDLFSRNYEWHVDGRLDVDPLAVRDSSDQDSQDAIRDEFLSVSLPLDLAPPFRFLLLRERASDSLLLNFSHVASDGIGILRFVRSVLRCYAGKSDPVATADLRHLRAIGGGWSDLAGLGAREWIERSRVLQRAQADAWADPPTRIACETSHEGPSSGVFRLCFPSQRVAKLQRARRNGATFNDLLLVALMQTIEHWNREHGVATGRIAILVPVNLRPAALADEIVSNLSMSATVSSSVSDRANPERLVSAVVSQTRLIKGNPAAHVLVDLWRSASAMPVLWKQYVPALFDRLAGSRYTPTALLSNVGTLREPLELETGGPPVELWGSPPCRLPMAPAIGAVSQNGDLHLSFRRAKKQMSADACRRFARLYISKLDAFE